MSALQGERVTAKAAPHNAGVSVVVKAALDALG